MMIFFLCRVLFQDKWVELRKEYVGFLSDGRLYIFRTGVFLPPNTSYGEQVCVHETVEPKLPATSMLLLKVSRGHVQNMWVDGTFSPRERERERAREYNSVQKNCRAASS